jgi:DNA-binding transcriptional ArsR family regulator
MVAAANLVEVAALVGDTARATILAALMGGQALTGTELAYLARVSRPTASEHLLKLVEVRLVAVIKQGRYCYYRIAFGRPHAGKYHRRRRDRGPGALSAALDAG